ncbi:MAG: hypothetical protein CVT48_03625 [Thermoplasmata archaeon HGW-Thermoplasmata-1]|nr:MAG: hypothetical protein CVT48_03625 [Thermoplasmata archaeon HGW-Thermoplasmata-1]
MTPKSFIAAVVFFTAAAVLAFLPGASAYEPHDPIEIGSDAEFLAHALLNGWSGLGLEDDPFIIEGYEIDATGAKAGIYIENTISYFIIQNCKLSGASGSGTNTGGGVTLYNVVNAVISNNICENNAQGILSVAVAEAVVMDFSTTQTISDNIFINNSGAGVNLNDVESASPCFRDVTNNTCNGNGQGMVLRGVRSNMIKGNRCGNNTDCGISLLDSESNIVQDNICNGNGAQGIKGSETHVDFTIDLFGGEDWRFMDNSFVGNTCSNNKWGIELESGIGNEVRENLCENNELSGIKVWRDTGELFGPPESAGEDNEICANTCNGCGYGITLIDIKNNIITGNNLSDNSNGIYLKEVRSITLENNRMYRCGIVIPDLDSPPPRYSIPESNTVNDLAVVYRVSEWLNGEAIGPDCGQLIMLDVSDANVEGARFEGLPIGAILRGCSEITLDSCDIVDCNVGVMLEGSSDCSIRDCDFVNNSESGLYLEKSVDNTIKDNSFQENNYGIYLHNTNGNVIKGNTFRNNYAAIGIYYRSDDWLFRSDSGESTSDDEITRNTFKGNEHKILKDVHYAGLPISGWVAVAAIISVACVLSIRKKQKRKRTA